MEPPGAGARTSGIRRALIGGLLIVVAGVISLVTFTNAQEEGGRYFVFFGPVIFGIFLLVSGLRDVARSRAASHPSWYPDPSGRHRRRFWDGRQWTDQVDDGSTEPQTPPLPPPPVAPSSRDESHGEGNAHFAATEPTSAPGLVESPPPEVSPRPAPLAPESPPRPALLPPEVSPRPALLPPEVSPRPATLPPEPRARRPSRWPTIRRWVLALMAAAAVAAAAAAFVLGRPLLVAAAWVYASLPIIYLGARAIRRKEAASRLLGAGSAALLAAAVGASTFLIITSCSQRVGRGAQLAECDLSGENLAGEDLSRADLSGANLSDANLRNAVLSRANLSGANLQGASLNGTNLQGANLAKADLRGQDLTTVGLAGAVFDQALLDGANLRSVELVDADFRGTSMRNARLDRATLDGADLSDAKLDGGVFTESRLRGALLGGASMRGATLEDADLTGVDLAGAVLDDSSLKGVTLVDSKGLSDDALATLLGVDASGLGSALIENEIRLEARDEILRALRPACQGGRVASAAGFPDGNFHPMVILDGVGATGSFTKHASSRGWEPMAVRFAQLVACVHNEERTTVQSCPYTLQGGGFATITRYQFRRRVRVVAAQNGEELFDQLFQGSTPVACPITELFSSFSRHETREGSHIGFDAIRARLERLVE
jgi:uncharacterized protein YjbI with pentapeptide repeats